MKTFLRMAFTIGLLLALLGADSVVHPDEPGTRGNRIAVIKIEGPIIDSEETIKQIRRYASRREMAALVLRINSPGGGVAATQEIYQEILKQRLEGMVVVTSMGSVAASGGYYLAAATDYIVANPGTITGSIGVIMAFPSVEGLFEKLGIDADVVKSGKFKDIGSPLKRLTEEERQVIQALIDDVYEQFVEAVVKGRKLDKARVKEIADGGVYSGRIALKLGLVDRLGTLDDAIGKAAKMAEIEGKPRVVMGRAPRGLWHWLFRGSYMEEIKDKIGGRMSPRLQYMWRY